MRLNKYSLVFLLALVIQSISAQEIRLSHIRDYEEGFNYPTDITVNAKGDVFVLDAMNDRVVVLKKRGEVTQIMPQRDTFYKAVGLAEIDGNLWIADTPRSRLLRLESNGRISQVIEMDHQIEPVDLVGIAGKIAVTDRVGHSITILDESRKEQYYWGGRGNKMGEFINPGFMAVAPENRLIIGDILNRRVMSYSQSGRFPQIIAKPGIEQGQVFRPKGVALDEANRIWVTDGYTGSIQLFSVSGKFLGIAIDEAGETLALSAPMGICLDDQERLWVVESYANKVSVWKIK